jgi:glycosyltransferase involved in cell wall biosynthesis
MEVQGALLTEGLVKVGHEVVLITTAHPKGLVEDTRRGVMIFYLSDAAAGIYSREWWSGSVEKFFELHREKPFDIVLSQSVSGWGYLKNRSKVGVPCVAIMHGTTFRDLKTRWASASSPSAFLRFSREAAVRLGWYLFRWLYWFRRFDAIIAVSEAVRGSLIKNYFLSPRRVFTVYNGIDTQRFAPLESQIPNSKSQKNILYLGRLDKDKGLTTLLGAVSNFQCSITNFQLLIVGSGPEFDYLNNRGKELGLSDAVEFIGPVPYEETPKYYRAADIFVLPSTAREGLPMTLIEAMAAGVPVVASNLGGIPEAVVDGETGILVRPHSVEDLSAALLKLLADDSLCLKMGRKAREVAEEKFGRQKMVEETLKVLEAARR